MPKLFRAAPPLALVRAALLILYALKMAGWFSAIDWSLPAPLLNEDYIQFWGRALRADVFLSTAGRFWGYDPFDMAGYVSGPFLEVGVHLISVIAHFLSPLVPIHRTLLVLEVAGLTLAPLLVIPAVRNFGGTRAQAWAAFAIALVFFGYIEPFSQTMARVGLYGFMVATFVAIFQVSLAWRWFAGGSWGVGAALCVVSALLFQLHPASLIIVAVPNIALFVVFMRRLTWLRAVATFSFVAVTLAANWYWIAPFNAFADWKSDAPYFVTHGFRDLWRTFNPWDRNLFLGLRWFILVHVLGLGVVALKQTWDRRRSLAVVLGVWSVSLFVAGFFGSDFSLLRGLQPGRNAFAFWMLAGVLAGLALPVVVLPFPWRRWCAGVVYVFCAAFMLVQGSGGHWAPLTNRMSRAQKNLITALDARRVDGRILVECFDWGAPHIADMLPFLVPGQAFLGGQHPGNFTLGRFSLFTGAYSTSHGWDQSKPKAFNRPMAAMGDAIFGHYLDLYNVRWVVAQSPSMKEALERYAGTLGSSQTVGGYVFYPVLRPSTWFLEGSGRVRMNFDRITISDASPGRLVLKSHWIKTLRVTPEVTLDPVFIDDDPVPFIALDNAAGHAELVVYNAGL